MEPRNSKGKKRKLLPDKPPPLNALKRFRGSNYDTLYVQNARNILHFSDYILHHIISFLDATSIYNFAKMCQRIKFLVENHFVWININAQLPPNTWAKNRFIWRKVNKHTKSLKVTADRTIYSIMSVQKLVFKKLYSSLSVLALEHQCIKYCKLNDFPNTLHELSLRWSFIPRHQEFFRFSLHAMARLRVLILDHCKWVESNCFMSICRFPHLEILSLYMCPKLGDDDISSISVSGRLGFKGLRVADLRFTGIGDLFVRTFYNNASLQVIYFQNFPATYYKERWERKLDILEGAKPLEPSYISDDETNNNISKKSLTTRFNLSQFTINNTQTVTNSTISFFSRVQPSHLVVPLPKSALYRYPYTPCVCGFSAKTEPTTPVKQNEDEFDCDSVDEDPSDTECTAPPNCWDKVCLTRKLEKEKVRQRKSRRTCSGSKNCYFLFPETKIRCGMIVNDSCASPAWCMEEASPSKIVHNWMYKREPRNEFEIEMLTYSDKHFRETNHLKCVNCGCYPDGLVEGNPIPEPPQQQPSNEEPDALPIIRETEVGILINRLVDYIWWIRRNKYKVDHECLMRGFMKFFDISDLLAPANDRNEFVAQFGDLLIQLARTNHNIYYVLCYHAYCLKDWMNQLQVCKKKAGRKRLTLYFFRNLVEAEQFGNDPYQRNRHAQPPKKIKDFVPVPHRRFQPTKCVSNKPYTFEAKYISPNEDEGTCITHLSLRGFYNVNDVALETLKYLKLNLLDVTGTNVTEKGVVKFLSRNPNCRVVHETACVCRPNLHF